VKKYTLNDFLRLELKFIILGKKFKNSL
jgi:hypothetical protein